MVSFSHEHAAISSASVLAVISVVHEIMTHKPDDAPCEIGFISLAAETVVLVNDIINNINVILLAHLVGLARSCSRAGEVLAWIGDARLAYYWMVRLGL
jgi:hypothetical protein